MRLRLDALFTTLDPVVAVHRSHHEADAALAALGRAGYGRDMLAVISESGAGGDVDRLMQSIGGASPHWAASGILWGVMWAVCAAGAAWALPASAAAVVALSTMCALVLVLQAAVVARVVAPQMGVRDEAAGMGSAHASVDIESRGWRFLVVVRGSRSEIALARVVLGT